MKHLIFLFAMLFAVPVSAKMTLQDTPNGPVRIGQSFDVEVSLGRGKIYPRNQWTNDARIRLGCLYMIEPWIGQIGMTAEINEHLPASLGLQAGVTHLWTGIWGELGAFVDARSGKLGYSAGAGISLVGVEYQNRMRSKRNIQVIIGRLRLPFGIFSLHWQ